jgi:ADP-heptose:LPS heptosyltransferase
MRVLVIKLAALGDVAQAFGPFAAIRAHHPTARITLLTTRPYAALARLSPWFDEVIDDGRPDWTDIPAVLRLARRLHGARFDRVYDLQTSSRSSRYRWFVGRRAEWSGIGGVASACQPGARRDAHRGTPARTA